MSASYHVFVYGSLLNVASASSVLKHITPSSYQPFFFPNATLAFDVSIPVATATWKGNAAFLNLHPEGDGVDGMLISVSKEAFMRLRTREKYYGVLSRTIAGLTVHTFSADTRHNCDPVLSVYVDKILTGVRCFGSSFYSRYLPAIENAMRDHPLINGAYKFEDQEITSLTNVDTH